VVIMLFLLEPKLHQRSFADINLENEIMMHKLQPISPFLFMLDMCKRRREQLVNLSSFDQVNVTMCDQLDALYVETIKRGEEEARNTTVPKHQQLLLDNVYDVRQDSINFCAYRNTHPNLDYNHQTCLHLSNSLAWFCKANAAGLGVTGDQDLMEDFDKRVIKTHISLAEWARKTIDFDTARVHYEVALRVIETSTTILTNSPFRREQKSLCYCKLYYVCHWLQMRETNSINVSLLQQKVRYLESAIMVNEEKYSRMYVELFKGIQLLPQAHRETFPIYYYLKQYLKLNSDNYKYDHKSVVLQSETNRLEYLRNWDYENVLFSHITLGKHYIETKQLEKAYDRLDETFQLMLTRSLFDNHQKTMEFCILFANLLRDMKQWEYAQIVDRFAIGCHDGQWETEPYELDKRGVAEFHKKIQTGSNSKESLWQNISISNSLFIYLERIQPLSNSWELTCFLLLIDIRRLKEENKKHMHENYESLQ
jgi:hypothetical protein